MRFSWPQFQFLCFWLCLATSNSVRTFAVWSAFYSLEAFKVTKWYLPSYVRHDPNIINIILDELFCQLPNNIASEALLKLIYINRLQCWHNNITKVYRVGKKKSLKLIWIKCQKIVQSFLILKGIGTSSTHVKASLLKLLKNWA